MVGGRRFCSDLIGLKQLMGSALDGKKTHFIFPCALGMVCTTRFKSPQTQTQPRYKRTEDATDRQ